MADAVMALVDTGPLVAAADVDEGSAHEAALDALSTIGLRLVIPTMVVAEATYLVGRRLGPDAEAMFLSSMASQDVAPPRADDWKRIAELVAQYREFPLGGTDASIVALAERLDVETIVTFDRRHFAAVRPRHVPAFTLLP